MKKILVTGFEPFGGRDLNPAKRLAGDLTAPEGTILSKCILPVEFIRSGEVLEEICASEKPDIILSIGQAGNNPHIAVERVAVNLDNSLSGTGTGTFADESGDAPVDRPISEYGPAAYFATLPVWDMIRAVNEAGIPCRASMSAGTFVCNHIMYKGCEIAARNGILSGFVHVPFLPEQLGGEMAKNGRYAMKYEDMLTALQTIVNTLSKDKNV